ncbi:MAG: NADH-quinone oxidoreductase subunit M [Ilumatobacteraceae bacterium]
MLTDQNWVLIVGTFLPLAGVVAMFFIPKDDEDTNKGIAIVTAAATLAVGIYTLVKFDYGQSQLLQFHVDATWIPVINSRFIIGLDGISLPLYFLSMVITLLVMIYSWDHVPAPGNAKAFYMLMLILQTGMAGTFVAQDLILFFVFFEVVLLPMYFMIGVWGGEQRQYASLKFFLYTMFGSALMLVAFLALFFKTGGQDVNNGFEIVRLMQAGPSIGKTTAVWIFAGMFVGFAVKVPMFPFHTWLPDAHTQAPTQGSVILAAILLKLGTYGFVRIAIPILPQAAREWAPWIGFLAVIGIIYGAFGCLAQTDMKRLIAFSSVAHMGYVMLGISTLTPFGINAAMFGMVAHGLITGMLFFVAGSVKERYHTLEIKRLSGLLKQLPKLGWIMGFCAMASLGLPGLAGFWGEFPAILSAYQPADGLPVETFRTFMVVAAIGTVFAAAYLLWLFQRTAFGEPTAEFAGLGADGHGDDAHGHGAHGHDAHGHDAATAATAVATAEHTDEEHEELHDVGPYEWIAWTPLLLAIVVLGVYPNLMFKVMDPAVTNLLSAFGK